MKPDCMGTKIINVCNAFLEKNCNCFISVDPESKWSKGSCRYCGEYNECYYEEIIGGKNESNGSTCT